MVFAALFSAPTADWIAALLGTSAAASALTYWLQTLRAPAPKLDEIDSSRKLVYTQLTEQVRELGELNLDLIGQVKSLHAEVTTLTEALEESNRDKLGLRATVQSLEAKIQGLVATIEELKNRLAA